MGAGILPVAFHNNKLYLLFSREFEKRNGKEDWRDFGGTPENNETTMETAIREGWEESMGFLGSKKDIKNLINNKLVDIVSNNKYTIYIVLVPYNDKLPKKFEQHFMEMYNKNRSRIAKNGLYEKDKLKWISLDNLPKKYYMFLPWYKKLVKQVYKKLKCVV